MYAGMLSILMAACGQSEGRERVPDTDARAEEPGSAAELPAAANGSALPGGLDATSDGESVDGDAGAGPRAGSESGGAAAEPRPSAGDTVSGAAAILQRAERTYSGIRSMEADFVQRVTIPLLDQTQDSRGKIFHRRPDRFLMRFSDPDGDVIVADGRHLWMYYPSADPRQVLRSTLAEAGSTVDLQQEFLSDANRRFDVTHLGVENVAGRPADKLRLIPREPSQYLRVTIWVDQGDAMVRRFEMLEQNESVRRLELRNLRPNVALPDDLFRFTPPPGAEVFDS